MNYIYAVWRFLFNVSTRYSIFLEKTIFLNNPYMLFKCNSFYKLPFYKKLFLINFFTKNDFKRVYFFLENMDKIHGIRLNFYTNVHNFFTKNYNDKFLNRKKTSKSILKEINTISPNKKFFVINDFVNLLLLKNIRYTLTWRKLNKNSIIAKYIKNNITFEIINSRSISGFIDYLSDDWDYSYYRRINKLNNFYNVKINDVTVDDDDSIVFEPTLYDFNKSVQKYNTFYLKLTKFQNQKHQYFGDVFVKSLKTVKFELNTSFKDFYKGLFLVKYRPTDNSQFLENSKNISAMFIRKNKIFNKGRYSRNRQLYRTGVYWCLWLNIINVFGLYYYFYRFVFNFGYFYIPLLILVLSIFGSRLIKYRFYNYSVVTKEFILFIELINKFITEIVKNFLIKSKELSIKLALYVYYTILNFFSQK